MSLSCRALFNQLISILKLYLRLGSFRQILEYLSGSVQIRKECSTWEPVSKFMSSMRFDAWNHMVPYDNFMPFPCMESHGIIWFHALPCMESYDSMHGIAWKVCRPWFHAWNRMESYGRPVRPCMELHGSLMNLVPGKDLV